MPHRRASLADLARTLGLSASTVSRALADHKDVATRTKVRVRQLADELGYQPNQLAAALRRGRTNTLGVLVPHIQGHFFPLVIHGITTEAARLGFNVMVCQSSEDAAQERRSLDLLLNTQVEGILVSVANTTHDPAPFEEVRRQGVPLVFFDRVIESFGAEGSSAVSIDDYQGAYQAVAHLAAQGCRRIAHFTGHPTLAINRHRLEGYHAALRDAGLVPDPALVLTIELGQAGGAAAMRQLLAAPERPDAVFAATDRAAVGALQVLKEAGLRVPHDVALVGFSNEVFTTLTEPTLTSVDQCGEEMGRTAVQLLHRLLEGQPAPAVVLQPKLWARGSSAR